MKIISMSLYGTDRLYQSGAIANARLARVIYPGWSLRIYCDADIPKPVQVALMELGVDLRLLANPGGTYPMFWRFWPAREKNLDALIVRDADSRLNVREKAAVDEWLSEGKAFHVMRDHPHHAQWPMLGGMWGVRGGVLPNMVKEIDSWHQWWNKLDDMKFLDKRVWPLARENMTHHSSVPTKHPNAKPFPKHDPYSGYVGEIIHCPTPTT